MNQILVTFLIVDTMSDLAGIEEDFAFVLIELLDLQFQQMPRRPVDCVLGDNPLYRTLFTKSWHNS